MARPMKYVLGTFKHTHAMPRLLAKNIFYLKHILIWSVPIQKGWPHTAVIFV